MKGATTLSVNMLWQMLDSTEKRRVGLLTGNQYKKKISQRFGFELRASGRRSFERLFSAQDADIRHNRLAVIDDAFVAIYDVTPPLGDCEAIHKCLDSRPLPIAMRSAQEFSLPVIRWSPEGSFFTTSGTCLDKNALTLYDSSTTSVVDVIKLGEYGSKTAYAHEHSVLDPALIAVGTSSSELYIADVRTGNVTVSSSAQHTDGILSVCWSISDENLVMTASSSEVLVWDRRYISKYSSFQLFYEHHFNICPQIKFLDSSRVIVMNFRNRIYVHNVYTGHTLHTITDVSLHRETAHEWSRYKFAINRDAHILYYPVKRKIQGIDLTSNKIVMDAEGGHIFPVEKLFFNDFYKELYSMNRKYEALIWTPFR